MPAQTPPHRILRFAPRSGHTGPPGTVYAVGRHTYQFAILPRNNQLRLVITTGLELRVSVVVEITDFAEYAHALAHAESIELHDRATRRHKDRTQRDT